MHGQFFETAHGPHTVIGCSDFLLFAKFARGEDIADVVAERRLLGFNDLRVFLSMHGALGTFDPRPHLDRLAEFCALIGGCGLRLELTVFCDTKRWLPNLSDQRALLHAVHERVLSSAAWVRLEGMNEGNYLDNMAEGIVHETLPGVLWSLGSKLTDEGTLLPVKDYGTSHPSRTSDWPRKVGHGAMEDVGDKFNIPDVSNECMRPDQNGYQARNFFDGAANGALLCAGATFHSAAGKTSTPFTDDERRCAEAWVVGANAVPLKYQRGAYTRGGLGDCPIVHKDEWASRTHVRILGNEACCVVAQRKPGWTLQMTGAWHVATQHESVIELVR